MLLAWRLLVGEREAMLLGLGRATLQLSMLIETPVPRKLVSLLQPKPPLKVIPARNLPLPLLRMHIVNLVLPSKTWRLR
jgi:hypothetical protein